MKVRKKNYLSLIGLFVILILGPMVYFGLLKPHKGTAAWFNDGWHYRKAVAITNSSGSALTDFQVSVGVGTSALIASGKMKTDCSDIRITDTNGKLLPHWLEGPCNSATDATVWTKVPSLPTSGGTVYIYYGNPSATNTSSTTKTFIREISGVVGAWTFNEGVGTTALDYSGNNNTGTFGAGSAAPGWVTGMYGIGVSFDGSNDYITTSSFQSQLSQKTICIWVNPTSSAGLRGLAIQELGFYLRLRSMYLEARVYDSAGTVSSTYNSNTALTANQWSHVCEVVNASTNGPITLAYYINGNQDRLVSTDKNGPNSGSSGNNYVTFGNDNDSTGRFFPGLIDEPRIYNQALTQAEITDLYGSGGNNVGYVTTNYPGKELIRKYVATSPTSSLSSTEEISKAPIAYWSFDEGQGQTANDSSTSRNAGTLGTGTSAPAWQTEDMCVSGKCLKFDGSNDYVNAGNPTSLKLNSFTISLWYKQTGSPVSYPNLVGHGTGGWSFGISNEAGNVGKVFISQSGQAPYLNSTTIPATNTWYHLVVTDDGTNTKIYVNGKLENNTASTPTFTFSNGLRIGQDSTGGGFTNGFLDEVKIYPYARSAAEIKADYNARGTQKGSSVKISDESVGISNGLIGYWKMDEGTGTSLTDSSGNSLTGTLGTGTSAPVWSAGMFGTGLSYDGAGDTVTISGTASSVKTISFWTKPSSTTNYFIDLDGTNSISASSGTLSATNFTSPAIYVNGSLSSTIASGSWQQVVVTTDTGITASAIKIGKISANHLNGLIDEVRIYNRALSPSEVRDLYNWAPGPVAYYNFNEGVGSSAFDSSGYGNNGTWSGTGTHWATGKYGKAGKFNGSNDRVQITSPNTARANGQPMTVEAWVYWKGGTGYQDIVAQREPHNWIFYLHTDNHELSFHGAGQYKSTYVMPQNQWKHVAATITAGGIATVYVDGQVVHTNASYSYNTSTTSTLQIGSAGSSEYFNGSLDEVKIYNYARTQKQIVEDMNAGHPAVGSPVGSALAHYKFDEGYGTTVHNSGNGGATLNGALGAGNSAPSWSQNGKFGKALSFDGSNDYVNVGNYSALNPAYITASAWVKWDGTANEQEILGKWGASGITTTAYALGVTSAGKLFTKIITATPTQITITDNDAFTSGSWIHVVVTYDGATVKLYKNGGRITNVTQVGSDTGNINTVSAPFYIGGIAYSSLLQWDGLIDEVKIYNYALTEDEVKIDYNRGSALQLGTKSSGAGNTAASNAASQVYCIPGDSTTCSPPVAEWLMDEGIGSSAFDTSGNGNNGGWNGTGTHWATGKIGKGLRFDGVDDYVDAGSGASLDITGAITLEAWVKSSTNTSLGRIFAKGTYGGSQLGYSLQLYPSTGGKVSFIISNGSEAIIKSNASITNGLWNHIVGVRDANGNMNLYVNGVQQTETATKTGSISNSYDLCIGVSCTDALREYFNATIDEVRIYNYARTPAQIAWDYNKGAPVAHWKLDECQGTTAHDSIGANTGSINIGASGSQTTGGTCSTPTDGTGAWYNGATGKYNASLNFDGTDDYVSVGTGFTAQSVSFWTKPASSTSNMIQLSASAYISASSGVISATGFSTPTIYVNGITSTTLSADSWQMVTVATATGVSAGAIKLGLANSTYYSGQLDDIKVWNYPLTSMQVKLLYNQGAVRFGD